MKSEEGLGDESFLYKQTGDTEGLVPRRPFQSPAWFHNVFNTVLKVKNNGCPVAEWLSVCWLFPLLVVWLTGSCDCCHPASREDHTAYCKPRKRFFFSLPFSKLKTKVKLTWTHPHSDYAAKLSCRLSFFLVFFSFFVAIYQYPNTEHVQGETRTRAQD